MPGMKTLVNPAVLALVLSFACAPAHQGSVFKTSMPRRDAATAILQLLVPAVEKEQDIKVGTFDDDVYMITVPYHDLGRKEGDSRVIRNIVIRLDGDQVVVKVKQSSCTRPDPSCLQFGGPTAKDPQLFDQTELTARIQAVLAPKN
jgi:hypothetical protein